MFGVPSVFSDNQIANEVWIGVAGAMLVLLRSIIDGSRRTWYALLIGCIIGGGGAALAGHIFHDSKWVYPICGVAAVMAENVLIGFFNASEEFRKAPIKVFTQLWQLIVPSFGKSAGVIAPAPLDPPARPDPDAVG